MNRLQRASRTGYQAYLVGRTVGSCPRTWPEDERYAWRAGWKQANEEDDDFHRTEDL